LAPGLSDRSETTAQSGIIDVGLAGGVENMSMCLAQGWDKGHTDIWVGEKKGRSRGYPDTHVFFHEI